MDIKPVSGVIGAEISGLDLSQANDETIKLLTSAIDEHLVVKIPGQNLDRFQLSEFGAKFGQHFIHPIDPSGYDDCPEVLELLKKPDDEGMFGGESWHADITWMKPVGYLSILHGVEIPDVGGDTSFSSTIAAFEQLSPGMQKMLRTLSAVHAYHLYDQREEEPWVAEHPIVRKHPVSSREGLYITRMFTSRIVGMSIEESKPLLEYLFAKMEQHDITCRFRWTAGDVLMWDNRFTLHYPINDFTGKRRKMIRTSVLET